MNVDLGSVGPNQGGEVHGIWNWMDYVDHEAWEKNGHCGNIGRLVFGSGREDEQLEVPKVSWEVS